MRRFCITYKSIYSSWTLPIKMLAMNFFHFEWKKKKNHKSIKMYTFFCVNSNASTTTYLKTKHTMEFVGFLFQIIIRNALKRAPFRWFGVLDLGRKAKQNESERVRKLAYLMSDKIHVHYYFNLELPCAEKQLNFSQHKYRLARNKRIFEWFCCLGCIRIWPFSLYCVIGCCSVDIDLTFSIGRKLFSWVFVATTVV